MQTKKYGDMLHTLALGVKKGNVSMDFMDQIRTVFNELGARIDELEGEVKQLKAEKNEQTNA